VPLGLAGSLLDEDLPLQCQQQRQHLPGHIGRAVESRADDLEGAAFDLLAIDRLQSGRPAGAGNRAAVCVPRTRCLPRHAVPAAPIAPCCLFCWTARAAIAHSIMNPPCFWSCRQDKARGARQDGRSMDAEICPPVRGLDNFAESFAGARHLSSPRFLSDAYTRDVVGEITDPAVPPSRLALYRLYRGL
jgi:hypothetical protein